MSASGQKTVNARIQAIRLGFQFGQPGNPLRKRPITHWERTPSNQSAAKHPANRLNWTASRFAAGCLVVGAVTGYPVSAPLFPVSGKFSANPRPRARHGLRTAQELQVHQSGRYEIFPSPNRECIRERIAPGSSIDEAGCTTGWGARPAWPSQSPTGSGWPLAHRPYWISRQDRPQATGRRV